MEASDKGSKQGKKGLSTNVIHMEGEFEFPNGDKYIGGFEARKNNLTVVRQGYGEYTTWDGQIYKGHWVNDQPDQTQNITIEFCDNSRYLGPIAKGKYSGIGTYTFPDKSSIECVFADNKPSHDALFLDNKGLVWVGGVCNDFVKLKNINVFHFTCQSKVEEEVIHEDDEYEKV